MILGRPTNLWLGFITSALAVVQILLVNVAKLDPVVTATLLGAIGLLLGSLISLIANQPPTVNPGDTVHVTTPAGQPNYVTTIATPPQQDAPPVPDAGGA
jgi:hypothetical protein